MFNHTIFLNEPGGVRHSKFGACASQPATGTLEFGLREMARQIATYYPIAVEALP
jgi:hypothetical protein